MAAHTAPDLSSYLHALRAAALPLAAGTVLAGVVVGVLSWTTPPQYRAVGTTLLVESKVADTAPSRPGGDYRAVHEVARQLLTDPASLQAVIEATPGLAGQTPESLADRLSTELLSFSPVVTVSLTAGSPELAVTALTRILEKAVALNARMAEEELGGSRAYLKAQVDGTAKALDDAFTALANFTRTARLDETRSRLGAALDLRNEVRQRLSFARANLAAVEANAVTLKSGLAARDQKVSVSRSVIDDPGMQVAAGGKTSAGATVKSEELNPAFVEVDGTLQKVSGEAAGFKAEVATLVAELARLDAELPTLQASLADKAAMVDHLTAQKDVALASYESLSKRYEEARVLVASRAPALRVLNAPLAQSRPVAPRPRQHAFAAALSALLVGIVVVLARHLSAATAGGDPR